MNGSSNSAVSHTADKDNIVVAVRVRPLNDAEQQRQDSVILQSNRDRRSLLVHAAAVSGHRSGSGGRKQSSERTRGGSAGKQFTFDRILEADMTQSDVFESTGVKQLIEKALDGYTATVFAYGQTGSGKTYTILGAEDPSRLSDAARVGIVPRAAFYLFSAIQRRLSGKEPPPPPAPNRDPGTGATESAAVVGFRVHAEFLEIYNEHVNDLLNPRSTNLPLRWNNEKRCFFAENQLRIECTSPNDMLDIVAEGIANRKVHSHLLNKDSSRSHSIFTVYVESSVRIESGLYQTDGRPVTTLVTRFGKIHFVDLAGSERLKESLSAGDTAVETGHINKSLLVLAKVIRVLSKSAKEAGKSNASELPQPQQQQQRHVPYRDSKLTRLLMDSLGGTSMTLMIACVTPSSKYCEETLNTLKYAARVKTIRNRPLAVDSDPNQRLIADLRAEIARLRHENAALQLNHNHSLLRPSHGTASPTANHQPVGSRASPVDESTGSTTMSRRIVGSAPTRKAPEPMDMHSPLSAVPHPLPLPQPAVGSTFVSTTAVVHRRYSFPQPYQASAALQQQQQQQQQQQDYSRSQTHATTQPHPPQPIQQQSIPTIQYTSMSVSRELNPIRLERRRVPSAGLRLAVATDGNRSPTPTVSPTTGVSPLGAGAGADRNDTVHFGAGSLSGGVSSAAADPTISPQLASLLADREKLIADFSGLKQYVSELERTRRESEEALQTANRRLRSDLQRLHRENIELSKAVAILKQQLLSNSHASLYSTSPSQPASPSKLHRSKLPPPPPLPSSSTFLEATNITQPDLSAVPVAMHGDGLDASLEYSDHIVAIGTGDDPDTDESSQQPDSHSLQHDTMASDREGKRSDSTADRDALSRRAADIDERSEHDSFDGGRRFLCDVEDSGYHHNSGNGHDSQQSCDHTPKSQDSDMTDSDGLEAYVVVTYIDDREHRDANSIAEPNRSQPHIPPSPQTPYLPSVQANGNGDCTDIDTAEGSAVVTMTIETQQLSPPTASSSPLDDHDSLQETTPASDANESTASDSKPISASSPRKAEQSVALTVDDTNERIDTECEAERSFPIGSESIGNDCDSDSDSDKCTDTAADSQSESDGNDAVNNSARSHRSVPPHLPPE